jgi:hypothetical protein
LAQFLRDWQVLPLLRDGETKEAWGARVMKNARVSITLGPLELPVKLVRRKHV